jgi:hypothetical protein
MDNCAATDTLMNEDEQLKAGFSVRDFEWKASLMTGTTVRGNLPLVNLGWRVQAQMTLYKLFNFIIGILWVTVSDPISCIQKS